MQTGAAVGCGDFSVAGQSLDAQALVVVACSVSICGVQAEPLCLWSPPRAGTEPVSPALAGRFLPTGPLGKPSYVY